MADFVAEIRPRDYRHSPYNQSFTNRNEFVAEVRPRQTNIFELRHPNSLYLSHGLSGRPSLAQSNDFVAEIRPRQTNNSEFSSENRQNLSQDIRNQSPNPSNDFVSEVRRKQTNDSEFSSGSRQNLSQDVRNQTLYPSNDFVAEIRPRQTNHSEFRRGNSQCLTDEVSDQDLMDILSGEHFSREDFIRILRGSILTLVEKLLTGRSLARIDGSLSVYVSSDSSPFVVNITQNYFTDLKSYHQTDESLENSLNIKIRHEIMGASINNHAPSLTKSPQSYTEKCYTMDETYLKSNMLLTKSPLFESYKDKCNTMDEKSNMILTKSPLFESYKDESTNMDEKCAKSTMSSEVTNDLLVGSMLQNYQPCFVNKFSSPREIPAQSDENVLDEAAETNCDSSDESDDESGYSSNYKSDSDASSEDVCTLPHKLEMYNEYYCSGLDEKNTMYIPFDYGPTLTKASEKQENTCGVLCDVSNDVRGADIDDNDDYDDDEFKHKLVIDENSSSEQTESYSGISNSNVGVSKRFEQSTDVEMEEITNVGGIRMDCKQDLFCFDNETRRGVEDMMDETDYPPSCEETDFANGWEDTDFPSSSDITDTDAPVGFHEDGCCSTSLAAADFRHKKLRLMKGPEQNLESHNQETSAGRNLAQNDLHNCRICCKTFTAKNILKRHLRTHTGQRPYKCSHCTQSFSRRDDFKDHQAHHEYANPFRCSKCAKGFTDREYLKNHMNKEHGSRVIHVCSQCGESYDEEEAFAAHRRTHPELLQFACTTCSFIGTNNQMIQKHFLLHSHKLFSCKPCNAYFADPFDYTNHIRTHKKSPTFCKYSCCFCDVTLPTYYQYKRHEHSHTHGKSHSCKTCKKIFKSKSLLQDHTVAIHQENFKDQTPSSPIDEPKFNQSTSMFWQAKEAQPNILPGPTPESKHSPMETLPLQPPSQMKTSPPCEGVCNKYEGELLDLSMKKENLNVSSPKEEKKVFVPCDRELEFGPNYFPRNGVVVSELCTLDNGNEFKAHAHLSSPTTKPEIRHEERQKPEVDFVGSSIKREWNSPSSKVGSLSPCSLSSGSSDAGSCFFLKPMFSTKLRNDEWGGYLDNSPTFKHGRRPLDQNTSKERVFKSPIRFNPYSREKFADLAAKFLAARGPKFLQKRLSMSTITSDWETRPETAPSRRGYLQTEQTRDLNPLRFKASPSSDGINGHNDNQMFFPKPFLTEKDVSSRGDEKIGHKSGRNGSNPETALVNRSQCLVQPDLQLGTGHDTKDVIKKEVRISKNGCVTNIFNNDINNNKNYIVENNVPMKQSSVVNVADSSTLECFECEECKEMFSTFSDLENHSVDVHKRYLCEHCKKSFTARPNRDRHVRYHTGERPYKCDLCELAFFRGDDLKYHRTTRHHTAQPFVCGCCDASFSWKRDLDRHIRHSKCKT